MNEKIADLAAMRAQKRRKRKCPICGKPATDASRPFCSETCRRIDLDRWRTETYRIPAKENDDEAESAPKPEDEES